MINFWYSSTRFLGNTTFFYKIEYYGIKMYQDVKII